MVIYAKIIIILNIFLQIHAENKLFSMFHQEIAKRFDRAKSINSEQRLWSDLKNKNAGYFKHGRDIQNSNKGYFIHVVPRDYINARREFTFNRYEGGGSVIGVPSNEWHLPNAEPILPGHTLLRPTLGMLKSAVSFPHLEHDEGGAGVYGNPSQLGIQYGGRSGRVLYSHNRRVFPDNRGMNPKTSDFTSRHLKSKFYLVPVTLDSVKDSDAKKLIVNILNKIKSKYQPRSNYSPNYNIADSALNRNIDERDSTRIVNVRRTPKMSKEMKSKQFWTTKDMFDHIKLSSNKPELSDLMPEDHNKVPRNWWYFNEDDLSQLQAAL